MRNCLISAVGRNSTHKQWTHGFCNFDLHLIVYDDSQNMYHNDAKFVSCMKGYKMQIIYKYIKKYYFLIIVKMPSLIILGEGYINFLI